MKVRDTQRRAKEINLMTTAWKYISLLPHFTSSSGDPNPLFLEFIALKNEATQSSKQFFLKIQACDLDKSFYLETLRIFILMYDQDLS